MTGNGAGGMASPLGRYGELVASVLSAAVVIAALAAHLVPSLVTDTAWLDSAALLVIGVVLGQRQTTNGAAKIATAANRRLDAIGAPAADSQPRPPADAAV